MHIKCPSCLTVFEVDKKLILQNNNNIKVKCSVCNNIWVQAFDKFENLHLKSAYKKLFFLNIILLFSTIAIIFLFKDYFLKSGTYWIDLFGIISSLVPIQ